MFRSASAFFLSLLILSCEISLHASDWELEYWQYWNWKNWERGPFKVYTVAEGRLTRDLSRFTYFRFTENIAYSPFPFLDLEAHYSYLYSKPRGGKNFSVKSRFEIEVNPSYKFDNGIQLKWRNRYELIKKQGVNKLNSVFRHRLMTIFPVENWGSLKSIYMFDEVIFDLVTNRFTQNRFAPLVGKFDLGKGTSVDLFFQIRSYYSRGLWYRSFVLGSQFFF